MPFVNIHTHTPRQQPGCIEIESVYFGQAAIPVSPLLSAGLHPWFLANVDLDSAESWLRAQAASPGVLAIGEAGLDKVCGTPWALQLQAFRRCFEISEATEKPLIIHCVRAFAELLGLKKSWKARQIWIFHGFDKKPPLATQLLDAGCQLSFGAALLRANSPASESLKRNPEIRFFLETDAADASIEAVYAQAARLLGNSISTLEKQLEANFTAVFPHAALQR